MATKSFIKEFAVDKKNASRAIRAINSSKPIELYANQRVEDVKKENIRKFFKMDN